MEGMYQKACVMWPLRSQGPRGMHARHACTPTAWHLVLAPPVCDASRWVVAGGGSGQEYRRRTGCGIVCSVVTGGFFEPWRVEVPVRCAA